jgi:hypothetical protein
MSHIYTIREKQAAKALPSEYITPTKVYLSLTPWDSCLLLYTDEMTSVVRKIFVVVPILIHDLDADWNRLYKSKSLPNSKRWVAL